MSYEQVKEFNEILKRELERELKEATKKFKKAKKEEKSYWQGSKEVLEMLLMRERCGAIIEHRFCSNCEKMFCAESLSQVRINKSLMFFL